MYSTTEFRRGLKIEFKGDPFAILEFQHVKPGKGGAFVRTRMKNLLTGNVLEYTFKSNDKVEKPDMEEKEMEYLYKDGQEYYFMDNSNYEQQFIPGLVIFDMQLEHATRCSLPSPAFPGEEGWYFNFGDDEGTSEDVFLISSIIAGGR